MTGLRVLAVDDEPPALDELAYLLGADDRVVEVATAGDAVSALRLLEATAFDAVFLDIRMPGLTGLDLARLLARFATPPEVVFVTAHDDSAVDAFALHAADYLLKPLRDDRVTEAVGRVAERRTSGGAAEPPATIAVERAGVTRFLSVADVRFVSAQGDYARLHTAEDSHLVRIPLSVLEQRWAAGFVRVHRSYLVAVAHISELRLEPRGGHVVRIGSDTLPVSRRHSRALKDRLVRRARLDAQR